MEVTEIAATTAVCSAELEYFDGSIAETGVCWSTEQNPTIGNFKVYDDSMRHETSFSLKMTDLSPNTKYYVRAYVINTETKYGEQKEFTTLAE